MPQSESTNYLTQHFVEAVKFLKKTIVDKQGKRTSLYKAPWYLVIGAENVGKTSLLLNSELKFTLAKNLKNQQVDDQEQLVCDWWVTKQAIFIDTPSKYFFVSSNGQLPHLLQQSFLKLYKKYRYKKQPGAIILVLDVYDLMKRIPQKKEEFFNDLSVQLRQINSIVHENLPIYVILNKCDLLVGFREFFNDLPIEERQQYWGILAGGKQQLENGFKDLMIRLEKQIIWRLHREDNINKRALIKDFPVQMAQLQDLFNYFDNCFFAKDSAVNFRGIFFLSAAPQQNDTVKENGRIILGKNKAFFAHDFFVEAIEKDRKILENLTKQPKNNKNTIIAGVICFAIIVLTVLIGSFYQQEKALSNARFLLNKFQRQKNNGGQSYVLTNINLLSALHQSETLLNKKQLWSWAFIDKEPVFTLKKQVASAYQIQLHRFLLPFVSSQLENVLQNISLNPQFASLSYSALKTYLMLSQNHDYYNSDYVLKTMQKIWQHDFSKNPQLQNELLAQLKLALQNTPFDFSFVANSSLISQARIALNKLSPVDLGYAIMQSDYADNQELTLNLNSDKDAAKILVFTQEVSINSLYTKTAYNKIYPKFLQNAANEVVNSSWVLGEKNKANNTLLTANQLFQQLSNLYFENYANAWEKFLNSIAIVNYTNFNALADNVNLLVGKNGLLSQLLNLFQNNMVPQVLVVDNNLNLLNNLVVNNNGTKLSEKDIENLFTELQTYLSTIQGYDQQQAIFKATKARILKNEKPDVLDDIFSSANLAPEPVRNWLSSIATNVWQLMLYQAEAYIEQVWQVNILPDYIKQVANNYPFTANASTNVEWSAFSNYFAPQGILDEYFNYYVQPFVNTQNWTVKTINGENINFSTSTLAFFKNFYNLQAMYFPKHVLKPKIIFNIKPVALESGVNDVTIILGTQQINYNQGNSFPNYQLSWPDMQSNLVTVSFNKNSQNFSEITAADPWAWVRVLQAGGLSSTGKAKHWLVTFDKNGNAARFEIITQSVENPFAMENFAALLPSGRLS